MSRIREMAIGTALEELNNIVGERGKRYALVLRGKPRGLRRGAT